MSMLRKDTPTLFICSPGNDIIARRVETMALAHGMALCRADLADACIVLITRAEFARQSVERELIAATQSGKTVVVLALSSDYKPLAVELERTTTDVIWIAFEDAHMALQKLAALKLDRRLMALCVCAVGLMLFEDAGAWPRER